jgi:formylglycine-generating enzyme required for sulfatase activity
MIQRELEKEDNAAIISKLRKDLGDRDYSTSQICDQVERILGGVALQMAIKGHWREVQVKNQDDEVTGIWEVVEARFHLNARTDREKQRSQILWAWAKEFAIEFQLNKGSTQGDLNHRFLSFRNRRVQEMWVARYLTRYASQEELTGATETSANDLNKARVTLWFRKLWDFVSRRSSSMDRPQPKGICRFAGDKGWGNLWKCAAQMPLETDLRPRHSPASVYQKVMSLIFNLPANPAYRRPTEAMWFCDSMLDRQAKLGVAEASQVTVALRKILTDRFDQLRKSGTARQKKIIAELLDPSTYVLLCSEDQKLRLPGDTGEFIMGPDPDDWSAFSVQVTLTPFGISKYLVTEEQYSLFDPVLPASEEHRMPDYGPRWYGFFSFTAFLSNTRAKINGEHRMPTYEPSWYDCYYFTVFLSKARVELRDGREYRFRIPTEAQGEYATRAGSKEEYFIGNYGQEVTEENVSCYEALGGETLAVDTWRKLPNRWGIKHPVGRNLQWRWDFYGRYRDLYPEGKATNPNGPSTGLGRAYRGASDFNRADGFRSAIRSHSVPGNRNCWGLRLALGPVRPPEQP